VESVISRGREPVQELSEQVLDKDMSHIKSNAQVQVSAHLLSV